MVTSHATSPRKSTSQDLAAHHVEQKDEELQTILQGLMEDQTLGGPRRKKDMDELEKENDMLRRQLERIGRMSTATGGFNVEAIQQDCERWKAKARRADELKRENRDVLDQLARLTEESFTLRQERDSLLTTIGFLQEELSASEQMRYNHQRQGGSQSE